MAKRYRPLGFRRKGHDRPRHVEMPHESGHQAELADRMRRAEERREKEEARAAEYSRAN